MKRLSKYEIQYIALMLDLPEILALCKTNSKYNDLICENKNFWINKIKRDLNVDYEDIKRIEPSPKYFYEALITNPDEIFYQVRRNGAPNYLLGLAAKYMYKLNNKKSYDSMVKGHIYYLLYQHTSQFNAFRLYDDLNTAIDDSFDKIVKMIQMDIMDVGPDSVEIYKMPLEKYYESIFEQLKEIEKKDTVVIDVPTLDGPHIIYDKYVLHKFVK